MIIQQKQSNFDRTKTLPTNHYQNLNACSLHMNCINVAFSDNMITLASRYEGKNLLC